MDTKKQTRKRIAVIPGDGIGQEVIPQAVKAIQASGADVELTDFDWGADRYLRDQVTVPPLLVPPSEADTKVVPAGSGKVRFAATAALPGLANVNV